MSTTVKSSSSIKLTWTKVSGADGYQIYRKTSGGSWEKVKTITSGSTTSYTNTGLSSGTKYTYKVRAYKTINGTKYYGDYSDTSSSETDSDVKFISIDTFTGGYTVGITFRLYGTSDDGETVNMYGISSDDENGWVIFESVPLGTYYLTESDSGGYVADTTIYIVTVRSSTEEVSSGTETDMYNITIDTYSGDSEMTLTYDDNEGGYIYYSYNIGTVSFTVKKATPQGTRISGVTLQLTGTSDYGTYYLEYMTTDTNSTVTFTDIEPGTYYLTETSVTNASPAVIDTNSESIWTVRITDEGKIYITENDGDEEELTSDTLYVYTITNIPYYGFGIYKTAGGENADGVTFRLEGTSDYGTYYDEEAESNGNGLLYFTHIEPGTYYLTEIDISDDAYPTNMSLPENTVWIVVITDEGEISITQYADTETTILANTTGTISYSTWSESGTWQDAYGYYLLGTVSITNTTEINLEFYKIASVNYEPISGVVFRLYDAATGGEKYDQTATSSSEGLVKFTGLKSTVGTYYLVEVNVSNSSPKAILDSTVYTVTVSEDGTVTVDGTEKATRDSSTGDIELDDDGSVIAIPNEIY